MFTMLTKSDPSSNISHFKNWYHIKLVNQARNLGIILNSNSLPSPYLPISNPSASPIDSTLKLYLISIHFSPLHCHHSLSSGPLLRSSKLLSAFPILIFSNVNTIQDRSFKKEKKNYIIFLSCFSGFQQNLISKLLTLIYKVSSISSTSSHTLFLFHYIPAIMVFFQSFEYNKILLLSVFVHDVPTAWNILPSIL